MRFDYFKPLIISFLKTLSCCLLQKRTHQQTVSHSQSQRLVALRSPWNMQQKSMINGKRIRQNYAKLKTHRLKHRVFCLTKSTIGFRRETCPIISTFCRRRRMDCIAIGSSATTIKAAAASTGGHYMSPFPAKSRAGE